MTITVYWSPMVSENYAMSYLDQQEPDRLLNHINKNSFLKYKIGANDFGFCPAFVNLFKSTYALRFTHDYELEIKDGEIWSNVLDQDFFNSQIRFRSDDKRFLGFNLLYYFFAEEELEMNLTASYFEDNSFNSSAVLVPGVYDISKWFRPIECSFIMRDGCNKLVMNKGDVYAYVTFNTKEKIKLKRFHATEELIELSKNFIRFNKKSIRPSLSLIPIYDAFARSKMKKYVLRKIKENLLD